MSTRSSKGCTKCKKDVQLVLCSGYLTAMENGPFIDDFPIETSIYKGFSMAMLNNQMVIHDMHIVIMLVFLLVFMYEEY